MNWKALLRCVLAAFGLPAFIALAIGLFLKQTTGLSSGAVLFDAAVAGQLAVTIAALGLAIRPRHELLRRRFLLTFSGLLFALLLGAGFGSWVARRNWGMNLTGNIVVDMLPHTPDLLVMLGWRAAVAIAAWIAVSFALARSWANVLLRREHDLTPVVHALMIVLMLATTGAIGMASKAGAAFDDPMFSLLGLTFYPALAPTAVRIAAWERDEELRRTFDGGIPTRKHVVLIISDGVRPDRLSFYGYSRKTTPFLESLTQSPGWQQVPVAYSAATESLGGIGSIVSGRSTRTMSGRSYGVVEYFARHGFRTHLFLNGIHNWYELRTLYGSKITSYHDLREGTPGIPLHDDMQIVDWLTQMPAADDRPDFLMMFLMGTHESAPLPPEEQHWSHLESAEAQFETSPPGPDDWQQFSERYDDCLLATDRRLEKIWKILEAKGYLRNSVVIYSSDHGQMLGEHHSFGHGNHVWEDTLRIPMGIWSDTALPPIDKQRTAWTPDIAPTLAEAAGLRPLPTWDGISLFSSLPRRAYWSDSVWHTNHVRAAFYEDGPHRWKLHQDLDEGGTPISEHLFDVASDPSETVDLIDEAEPQLIRRLQEIGASDGTSAAAR